MPGKSGKKGNVAARVWALAQPLAEALGLTLWDVQYQKEGADWFLRVLIDREGGVGIDDCVDMTHALDPVLDAEDPVPQEYMLEVSSPGWERKLTRKEHFLAYEGKGVRVRLIRPGADGQRELTGMLGALSEDGRFDLSTESGETVTLDRRDCAAVTALPPELDPDDWEAEDGEDAPEEETEE